MYFTRQDKRGRTQYLKNTDNGARFVSKAEYEKNVKPDYIKENIAGVDIEGGVEGVTPPAPEKKVETPPQPKPILKAPVRECIFTGETGSHLYQRFVEGQRVYLNEEMYQTKTIGEIVQKMREVNA